MIFQIFLMFLFILNVYVYVYVLERNLYKNYKDGIIFDLQQNWTKIKKDETKISYEKKMEQQEVGCVICATFKSMGKNTHELPSFQEIDIWGEATFKTWEVQCAGFLLRKYKKKNTKKNWKCRE